MFRQSGRSRQGVCIGTKKTRLTIKDKGYMDIHCAIFPTFVYI